MSNLIVQLVGGMGNQMFQYAHGRALARKYHMGLALDFVCDQRDTPRSYQLDRLRVTAVMADTSATQDFKEASGRAFSMLKQAIPQSIQPLRWRPQILREQGFPVQPLALDSSRDAYLIGYWQSERYFSVLSQELRSEFQPVTPPSTATRRALDMISAHDSVSVHVRRGDYVTRRTTALFHGVLGIEYYRAAIARLEQERAGAHYYVFTDDPSWVRTAFDSGVPFTLMEANDGDTPEWDLILMSACRRHIIANSSFSWWGAWLDSRPDKRVIAPQGWFVSPDAPDVRDLLPADWSRL